MGIAPGRLHRGLAATGVVAAIVVAAVPAAAEDGDDSGGADAPVLMRVEVVAGTGQEGFSGDGGDALDARLDDLWSIDVDGDGNIYVADMPNGRLRMIDADGTIDTVPGSPTAPALDAAPPAQGAPDNRPLAVAVGDGGDLYVAASDDVRRRDAAGTFRVVAGVAAVAAGEAAVADGYYEPRDMALDPAGNIYLTDDVSGRVRRIDPAGVVTTIAGGGDLSREASEGGPGTAARVDGPGGLAVDADGNVYFTEDDAGTVRRVAADGTITTVVGTEPDGYAGDGGPAAEAQLSGRLGGLAVGDDGALFIADRGHGHIRRVDPDGTITTVPAGVPEVGDIAVGPDGVLYAATRPLSGSWVMRISERGDMAAPGGAGPSGDPAWAGEEPGTVVPVAGTGELDPSGIAVDAAGNLYVGEEGSATDGGRIHVVDRAGAIASVDVDPTGVRIGSVRALAPAPDGSLYVAGGFLARRDPDGVMTVVAGGLERLSMIDDDGPVTDGRSAIAAPIVSTEVAVGPEGRVYVADVNHVYVVEGDGTIHLLPGGSEPDDGSVRGIAVDGAGNVYVARDRVQRITPDGEVEVIAGSGSDNLDDDLGDGGPATEALLRPTDVAVDADGTVYVGESTGRIRRISDDGTIDTVAEGVGVSPSATSEDPDAVEGEGPASLAVDGDGNLFAATPHTSQVQVVVRAGDLPGTGSGGGLVTVPRVLAAVVTVALVAFAFVRRDRLAARFRPRS
jgi:sugar lactone lactonase YvrE